CVSLPEFAGPREWFEALDKNRDGLLTSEDFEWFGDSALARASTKIRPVFSEIDRDGNGQITAEEWKLWFGTLAGTKGYVSQDDLLPLFMDRRPGRPPGGGKPGGSRDRLPVICSYLSGDVGSLNEGPSVGDPAP